MTIDIYEEALKQKEAEVHTLRVRVKELVSEVSILKTELNKNKKVQSDFGYSLVSENPDASHIKKREEDE
tara:strand:- start:88 stop:297 length:210 start_codon:yes stop_codon:yes gene_type:complete